MCELNTMATDIVITNIQAGMGAKPEMAKAPKAKVLVVKNSKNNKASYQIDLGKVDGARVVMEECQHPSSVCRLGLSEMRVLARQTLSKEKARERLRMKLAEKHPSKESRKKS